MSASLSSKFIRPRKTRNEIADAVVVVVLVVVGPQNKRVRRLRKREKESAGEVA